MAIDQVTAGPFRVVLLKGKSVLLALGVLIYFVGSLTVGALLHLDLPITRAAVARIVEKSVSSTLRGRFHIREISYLAETGVQLEGIEIQDPANRAVIRVRRLRANVNPIGILKRVLAGYEKLSVEVSEVRAEGFEVYLLQTQDKNEAGERLTHLSLSDAFEPVHSNKKPDDVPSKPIRIWFPQVDLVEVYARGNIAGSDTFEAKVHHARASVLATEKGAAIDVGRFGIVSSGVMGAETLAHGEVHVRAPGAVWGMVGGTVGEIPLRQEFRFENDSLELKGSLPKIAPAAARALLGEWPLDQRISIENNISGKLDALRVALTIRGQEQTDVWPGNIEVKGTAQLGEVLRAKLRIITHSLDVASFDSRLPHSEIDSETVVEASIDEGKPSLDLRSMIQPGIVQQTPSPAINLDAQVTGSSYKGKATFEEEGFSAKAHVSGAPGETIDLALTVTKAQLEKNPRLRQLLPGASGQIEGRIQGTLDGDNLATSGTLNSQGLRHGDVAFKELSISFTSKTDLSHPEASFAEVQAGVMQVSVGEVSFDRVNVSANGPVFRPKIELSANASDGAHLSSSGELNLETHELFKFNAVLTGRGEPVMAKARHAKLGDSRLMVSDFEVKSIGEIKGSVDLGMDGGKIDLSAVGLNLARIGGLLGYPKNEFGGRLNANIQLQVGKLSYGSVELDVKEGAFLGLTSFEFNAKSDFDGQKVKGSADATIADLGSVSAQWDGSLAGALVSARSYRDATGSLGLQLRDIDLKTLTLLNKNAELPKLEGFIDATLEVNRFSESSLPTLELEATTRDLLVEFAESRVRGVDLSLAANLGEDSDIVAAALHIRDPHGPLAAISGEISLPLADWAQLSPDAATAMMAFRKAPLNVVAVIPERRIDSWPAFVPRLVNSGSLSARLVLDGSFDYPELDLLIDGRALEGGHTHFGDALDLKWTARYVAQTGSLRGKLSAERSLQRLGSVHYDLVVPQEHFFVAPPENVPLWTGSAQLLLESSPLHLLEELKKVGLSGRAQGSVEVRRNSLMPELSGELHLRNLSVREHRLGDARLDLRTHEKDLIARAEFSDEFGSLRLSGELGVTPTSVFATPADNRPIFLTLHSEQYNAAVLAPFLADVFDEFSGNLNGQLRAELRPPPPSTGKKSNENDALETVPWQTSFSGNLELKEGVFTPSALGLRMSDAQFGLSASPKGTLTTVKLNHFRAKADSRKHNLSGEGEFLFRGFSLDSGRFLLKPDQVPFLIDGVKMADLTGEARGRLEMREHELNLEISIDEMSAKIAEATDSNLISLDENPNIEILQAEMKNEETEVETAEDALAVNLLLRLGENVRLKGTGIDIRVTGAPELRIAQRTEMRGDIKFIRGGRFQILGRSFTLEPGALTFDTGESDNPHVNVAASWTAPNGVIVRMSVRGTVKEPVLEWTSEPALPGGEGEVIALVLGGSSNADQANMGQASLAIAANEALGASGVSGVQVYMTQQDGGGEGRMASMTESNWSNYTAAIRLNEELWFEGSLQKGSTGFQSGERQGVSGTLDWRFHPQWSARTELGTLGAGLDLLWRYRY